jgi:hypothetical protein
MQLTDLGWEPFFEKNFEPYKAQGFCVLRIIKGNREKYVALGEAGEFACEISGKFRFEVDGKASFPTAGDWVVASVRPKEKTATIHALLPRKSSFSRKVTGIYGVIDRIYVLGTDDFGNGGVVYYDINDDTWTTVLTPGDYTVSKMQVNASGDVLFYGVRNSDGATVMGKVFSSGSLTIISENTDMNVQSIIRIN